MTVPNQVLRRRRRLGRHRQIGPRLRSHQSTSPGPTTTAQIALISRHVAPDVRTSRPARSALPVRLRSEHRRWRSRSDRCDPNCRISLGLDVADRSEVVVIMRDCSDQPRGRFSHGGGTCLGRPRVADWDHGAPIAARLGGADLLSVVPSGRRRSCPYEAASGLRLRTSVERPVPGSTAPSGPTFRTRRS